MTLHLEKKGLRGLAIAESFHRDSATSVLSGIVMRRDFVIDGVVFGRTTLKGDDATEVILSMFKKLQRHDLNYMLVSGLILSMYNIVDIKKLHDTLQIPVIGIAYHDSNGLTQVLKHHFPNSYEPKLASYEGLGSKEKIRLHTSAELFVRREGCSTNDVVSLLNSLTLQGSLPEPVRVSRLLSRTLLAGLPH